MSATLGAFEHRRVVVLGGSGFIGSHVVAALVVAGAEVVSFDARMPDYLPPGAVAVQGDITDAAAVTSVIEGTDAIFALAGGLGPLRSMGEPTADLMSSCAAQLVLLEAVRAAASTASVVFAGSRLEYGPAVALPVNELHPLRPESPYAIHKAACSSYYETYARLYELRTSVLRLSNPYGAHVPGAPRDAGYGILNLLIDTALGGDCIQLYGGGTQIRDFVHVSDVARAALAASATPQAAGEVFNIGSGEPCSLRAAAELILELSGSGTIDGDVPWPTAAAAVETGDFYFDVSKAAEILGWRPSVDLRDGLAGVVRAMAEGHAR